MADNHEKIELRLIAKAELGDLQKGDAALKSTDKAAAATTAELKKLEAQAQRTASAVRQVGDPSASLATGRANGGSRPGRNAEQLRAEEKAAGLRTENSMRAEDAEAATSATRRRKFLEDAQARKSADVARRDNGLVGETSGIKSGFVGILTAIGTAAAVAAKSLKEYGTQQSAVAGLDAALAQHGLATSKYREELQALAHTLSSATAVPVDSWLDALNKLTQAGANESDIAKLAKGVEDLAGVMSGNIPHASLALQKAMEGNFDTLREWGIRVPEGVSQAQKLDAALQQAATKGAGQLRDKAQSLSGQLDGLKIASNNFLAAIGGTVARSPLVQGALSGMTKMANLLARAFGSTIPPVTQLNNALTTSNAQLEAVRAGAAKAAAEFNGMRSAVDRATQALNRQKSAADQILDAQNQLADAELEARLAQVDAAEKRGMNPQMADGQRAQLRAQAATARFAREQQAENERVAANERYLNSVGNQVGLLEGERGPLAASYARFQEAHAARAEAGTADLAANEAERRFKTADAMKNAIGKNLSDMQDDLTVNATSEELAQLRSEMEATRAKANATKTKADSFGPEFSNENGSRLAERLATVETALGELTEVLRRETPRVQDENSSARLRRDTRSGVFQFQQEAEGYRNAPQAAQAAPVVISSSNSVAAIQQENERLRHAISQSDAVMVEMIRSLNARFNQRLSYMQAELRRLGTHQ